MLAPFSEAFLFVNVYFIQHNTIFVSEVSQRKIFLPVET